MPVDWQQEGLAASVVREEHLRLELCVWGTGRVIRGVQNGCLLSQPPPTTSLRSHACVRLPIPEPSPFQSPIFWPSNKPLGPAYAYHEMADTEPPQDGKLAALRALAEQEMRRRLLEGGDAAPSAKRRRGDAGAGAPAPGGAAPGKSGDSERFDYGAAKQLGVGAGITGFLLTCFLQR